VRGPLTLNTELFELTAVTVTFAPLAVRLPDAVPLVRRPRCREAGWSEKRQAARLLPCPFLRVVSSASNWMAFEVMVTLPLATCGGGWSERDAERCALPGRQRDRSSDPTQTESSPTDCRLEKSLQSNRLYW